MLGPKSNCWRVVKQLQNICLHAHSSRFTRHTEPCSCEPAPAPVYAMVFCHICNLQQYCKHSDHSREERLWWVLNFERNNDSVLFFGKPTKKEQKASVGSKLSASYENWVETVQCFDLTLCTSSWPRTIIFQNYPCWKAGFLKSSNWDCF